MDYEEYVTNVIKFRTYDAEEVMKNIKKGIATDVHVSYGISCHIRDMSHCTVNIYENGYITTYAYADTGFLGTIFGGPKDQKVTYRISEEKAKEIIELSTNRYLEIKETIEREQAELKETAKIETALNLFEQSEEPLKTWYNYEGSGTMFYQNFPDTNCELLPMFQALEYEQVDEEYVWEKARSEDVTYRIDDDLVISVFNHIANNYETNYGLVGVRVADTGKYPQSSYLFNYYKIDSEKGKELVQKVRQLFFAYNGKTLYVD